MIKTCVYCGKSFEDKDGGRRTICDDCKCENAMKNNRRSYKMAIENGLTMIQVSNKARRYIKGEAKKNKITMHKMLDNILKNMC